MQGLPPCGCEGSHSRPAAGCAGSGRLPPSLPHCTCQGIVSHQNDVAQPVLRGRPGSELGDTLGGQKTAVAIYLTSSRHS